MRHTGRQQRRRSQSTPVQPSPPDGNASTAFSLADLYYHAANDSIVLVMRDGAVVSTEPRDTVGHLNLPVRSLGSGRPDSGENHAFR